jgi:NAD+ synthase
MDWEQALAIDPEAVAGQLVIFIREEMERAGFSRLVVGLSGGIDSAVSCALAVRALGRDKVTALIMPYRSSNPENVRDAEELAARLGIETITVDITPMVDAYYHNHPDADQVRRGNMMARQRMAVLYDYSPQLGALVLGTGNKTEAMLGYTTLYGDNACAFNPMADLWKTQVRRMAGWLGIPEAIITKAPSADLWAGQTDEEELGLTYEQADRILHGLCNLRLDPAALSAQPYDLPGDAVDKVVRLIRGNRFKRSLPAAARITDGPYEPDI